MYRWSKILLEDIQEGAQLLGSKAAVYYLLKMYAGSSPDQIAYPAQDTLAGITGLSVSTIQKALKQLIEANWIQHKGYTDSLKRTAIYRIVPVNERGVHKILQGGGVKSYEGGTEDFTDNKESSKKNQEERGSGLNARPSSPSSSSPSSESQTNNNQTTKAESNSFWNNLQGL